MPHPVFIHAMPLNLISGKIRAGFLRKTTFGLALEKSPRISQRTGHVRWVVRVKPGGVTERAMFWNDRRSVWWPRRQRQ